jgi:hypothetical protein
MLLFFRLLVCWSSFSASCLGIFWYTQMYLLVLFACTLYQCCGSGSGRIALADPHPFQLNEKQNYTCFYKKNFKILIKILKTSMDRHQNGKSDPVPDWHHSDAEPQHCIVQYASTFSTVQPRPASLLYLSFVVCLSHFWLPFACRSFNFFELKICKEVREYRTAIFSSIFLL